MPTALPRPPSASLASLPSPWLHPPTQRPLLPSTSGFYPASPGFCPTFRPTSGKFPFPCLPSPLMPVNHFFRCPAICPI